MEITCRVLNQHPALKVQLANEVPTAEDVAGSLGKNVASLGLPGTAYTHVVRVEPLQGVLDGERLKAFRLLLDRGTYGPQWEVVIAICGCETRHAAIGDFTPSLERLQSPLGINAD